MTFWRSDLWSFCLVFGLVALGYFAAAINNAVHGESGLAFGDAFVGLIMLTAAVVMASIDRGEAIRRSESFATFEPEETGEYAWNDSALRWENIPPGKRNPPPGMIG